MPYDTPPCPEIPPNLTLTTGDLTSPRHYRPQGFTAINLESGQAGYRAHTSTNQQYPYHESPLRHNTTNTHFPTLIPLNTTPIHNSPPAALTPTHRVYPIPLPDPFHPTTSTPPVTPPTPDPPPVDLYIHIPSTMGSPPPAPYTPGAGGKQREGITFYMINARGLYSPHKRVRALRGIRALWVLITFFQETHFLTAQALRFSNKYYPTGYFTHNPSSKTNGRHPIQPGSQTSG
ncbi:Hypothetical predicted protein [Pelobates cultripes]|uniref:Uncharacterized protein n=1 Tax=Pelobates cultripes TaxID=61616 RepID=A0AAD1RRB4_PELCU|nr:Hypothetical predicted protein [Pelobates cultripes]